MAKKTRKKTKKNISGKVGRNTNYAKNTKNVEADSPKSTKSEESNASKSARSKTTEQQIKTLIEKGGKKGFLTYDEMNKALPEEAVSPDRLDRVLATLDDMGIDLLDEAHAQKQQEEDFEEEDTEKQVEVDEVLEKQLLEPEATRRIDDPIRMYLTQMGQIPLLNRKAEITLARKIEIARKDFRRKLLQCDYCARNALDLLQQVHQGILSFDRTIKPGKNYDKETDVGELQDGEQTS